MQHIMIEIDKSGNNLQCKAYFVDEDGCQIPVHHVESAHGDTPQQALDRLLAYVAL